MHFLKLTPKGGLKSTQHLDYYDTDIITPPRGLRAIVLTAYILYLMKSLTKKEYTNIHPTFRRIYLRFLKLEENVSGNKNCEKFCYQDFEFVLKNVPFSLPKINYFVWSLLSKKQPVLCIRVQVFTSIFLCNYSLPTTFLQ